MTALASFAGLPASVALLGRFLPDSAGWFTPVGSLFPFLPRLVGIRQDLPRQRTNRFSHAPVVSRADPYSARTGGHDQPRPAYKSANS